MNMIGWIMQRLTDSVNNPSLIEFLVAKDAEGILGTLQLFTDSESGV